MSLGHPLELFYLLLDYQSVGLQDTKLISKETLIELERIISKRYKKVRIIEVRRRHVFWIIRESGLQAARLKGLLRNTGCFQDWRRRSHREHSGTHLKYRKFVFGIAPYFQQLPSVSTYWLREMRLSHPIRQVQRLKKQSKSTSASKTSGFR